MQLVQSYRCSAMAQSPATTSGRHHADHWQHRSCFTGGRGLPARSIARTFQAAISSQKQQRHRKRSCRTFAAASTMAEEMVAEPVSSERRQIQQMLNRYVTFWGCSRAIPSRFAKHRISSVCHLSYN